jgi:hypothetical protein
VRRSAQSKFLSVCAPRVAASATASSKKPDGDGLPAARCAPYVPRLIGRPCNVHGLMSVSTV